MMQWFICVLLRIYFFLHEWSHVMITKGTHTYIKETISPFILPFKVGITDQDRRRKDQHRQGRV
jgi:hypothetical protein